MGSCLSPVAVTIHQYRPIAKENTEELVLDVDEVRCMRDEIDISVLNTFLMFHTLGPLRRAST